MARWQGGTGSETHHRQAFTPANVAVLLFVAFLALRWLSRSEYLINWDAVQFALGVEAFDLATHQPHPPGYIGYMFLGRLLAPIVGDVPAALTLISVVSGALAPSVFFLLARRMLADRYALASALLFGVSPLLWHYSGVALTYAPEVALSLLLALFLHRARETQRFGDLIAAAVTFAVLGSVRQSALLLLAPLWVLGLRRFTPRLQLVATIVLGLVCLAWTVPLIWASGGLLTYVRESAALAELSVGRTAFVTAAFTGLLQNIGLLALGVLVGMHATPFVLWLGRRRPGGSLGALRQDDRRFLLAWALAPAIFFVFIHTGQPGYALLIIPVGYLWVGSALAQFVEHPALRRAHRRLRVNGPGGSGPGRAADAPVGALPQASSCGTSSGSPEQPQEWNGSFGDGSPSSRKPPRLSVILGALSVTGVVAFLAVPSMTYRAAASEVLAQVQHQTRFPSPADRTGAHVHEAPSQSPLAQALRQYSIPRHDAYWAILMEFIQRYSSDRSVVLTGIGGPIISGSFRQLGYYLPDYRVYAVGWDRAGTFGYLFETHQKESTYTVAGLRSASSVLALPADIRWVVIPDADVAALLDPSILTSRHKLENGTAVTVAHVTNGRALKFLSDANDARIELH